jgi:hypothetical protein
MNMLFSDPQFKSVTLLLLLIPTCHQHYICSRALVTQQLLLRQASAPLRLQTQSGCHSPTVSSTTPTTGPVTSVLLLLLLLLLLLPLLQPPSAANPHL